MTIRSVVEIVSIFCVGIAFVVIAANSFFLKPQQDRHLKQLQAIEALNLEIEIIRTQNARLMEEHDTVLRKMDDNSFTPAEDTATPVSDWDIANRLERVERELAVFTQAKAWEEHSSAPASESLIALFDKQAAKSQTYHNVIGEELFQSDYGLPLDGQEDNLSTAFQRAGINSNLAEFSCKSTICKVTYRASDKSVNAMPGVSSVDDALINEITNEYGGADLSFRHGIDGNGNRVMYIQEAR